MAVTTWTSDGMTWPVVSGTPFMPYAEALRLALVERCTAAGVAVPSILQSELTAGTPIAAAWGEAFDSTMDALFGRYLNHEAHLQDWDSTNLAQIIGPTWNEAALLAATGASARLRVGAGYPMLAAWAQQQYDLINLLRWTWGACAHSEHAYQLVTATSAAGLATAWPGAWTAGSLPAWGFNVLGYALGRVSAPSYFYEGRRIRSRATVPTPLAIAGLPVRVVLDVQRFSSGQPFLGYSGQGTGYVDGCNLIADSVTGGGATFDAGLIGDVLTVPPDVSPEVDLPGNGSSVVYGFMPDSGAFYVVDYAAGFQFIA